MGDWWESDPVSPLVPGNIDLGRRPRVRNSDGSVSTVRSIGVNMDGREYLIPTVTDDGRVVSDNEAVSIFRKTGKHLGAFKTAKDATAYAKSLHNDQETMVGFDGMRPMTAHTPKGAEDWWKADPIAEAPREVTNYRGLRIGSDGVVNPEPTDEEKSALLRQTALVVPTLGGPLMAPALATGVGVTANLAAGNVGGAAVDAAMGLIPGGRLVAKFGGKALMARMVHKLGRAAKAAEAAEPIVEKAASNSYRPGVGVPMFDVGEATNVVKMPIRLPAQSASMVAEEAATVAKTAPRKLAPIPAKGQSRLGTVHKPIPVQGPKSLTEAQIVQRARQLEAAKAAGVDLGEAFGGAVRPGAQAEQAVESALETRLRASVMMRKDPMGLANEITEKAVSLKGQGLSRAKVISAVEETYGLSKADTEQMVEWIFKAHGIAK